MIIQRFGDLVRGHATAPIILKTAPELGVLPLVDDVTAYTHATLPSPGVATLLAHWEHIPEEVMHERLVGKTGGTGKPLWHDGAGGAPVAGVHICRVREVLHAPEFGAVISASGEVFQSSIAEALYLTPDLSGLPYASSDGSATQMTPHRPISRLKTASVFIPWGARFNYGHFILDALPALSVLQSAGALTSHPAIVPPLSSWQTEALELLLGEDEYGRVSQISSPLVHVDDLMFASPMDHFLHAPNHVLSSVRETMVRNVNLSPTGIERIYVSRRTDDKRRLLNEGALEAALIQRGFTVVHAADHSIRTQIALFRDATVVVGPTGAALANAVFCRPDAKVFEIQPTNYLGIWTRAVCHTVGVVWYGYFAPSPAGAAKMQAGEGSRSDTYFDWELDLVDFIAFLDSHIA